MLQLQNTVTGFKLYTHLYCNATVAGMTGSGKTVWVMNLLELAAKVMKPPRQRIVYMVLCTMATCL
jgi:Flp pilus assembly CpaF family ATPase